MSSDDDVCHCVEDEPNVASVSGTRKVSVDLFLFSGVVQGQESLADVVLGVVKCIGTYTKERLPMSPWIAAFHPPPSLSLSSSLSHSSSPPTCSFLPPLSCTALLSSTDTHTHARTHTHNKPVYSGKQIVSGDLTIFSLNRSFLFRNRIIEVDSNHRLLQIESNSFILSFIRFCKREHHNYDDVEKKCHIVEKKHHIIMMNIPLSVFTYTFTFPFQKLKTFTLI